ncbi:TIGR04086 family membrane protein [Terrisporobacter sp.]|uniref:TIGR04086 family membrane protein n=1 Tax=Terrisporobacter sp. TaxID=1965305 RepID=UPI0026342B9E|nr:TIGR04086 family membrane protein [Terrisporobacter sp.]
MSKTIHILKGLGYAYIITLTILLGYNLLLTYTGLSYDTVSMVTSFITTISAAFGGFYACRHIKEKGLIYGFIVGISYMIILVIMFYLAKEKYIFDMTVLYKVLLVSAAGGIGGILGVNFK